MTPFKCKLCGGDIVAESGQAHGKCDSCGTATTLPKATDEQKINLYNRANHFRRKNEFDQAVLAYENILNIDSKDAEAHWGLVLSKYGIEYVEDPASHNLVPTCHRVQSGSILADLDYLTALENAPDGYTRSLYEEEAKRISEIQKRILAISSMEKPYDVFICYKETTDGGSRTKDSALAQEVYHRMVNDGLKVFFARITLEDKLGQEYEPYIFAALQSAKVMILVGTKPEHFNAVWVKNEWSRFLALAKKDRNRLLIPCYQEMDAYDLPSELSNLQSQDMAKIGFVQDLIRGVKKVLEKTTSDAGTSYVSNANPAMLTQANSLLERSFIVLEDGEWQKADELLEQVLNFDPKNARAYIGKLLVKLKLPKEDMLPAKAVALDIKSFTEYKDYEKALRFADAEYRTILEGYEQDRKEMVHKKNQARLEREYQDAVSRMALAKHESEFDFLLTKFVSLSGYKDADAMAQKCYEEVGRIQREWEEEELRQQKVRQEEEILQQEKLRQEEEAKRIQEKKDTKYGCISVLVVLIIIVVTFYYSCSKILAN